MQIFGVQGPLADLIDCKRYIYQRLRPPRPKKKDTELANRIREALKDADK